jgi:hypothetical protein
MAVGGAVAFGTASILFPSSTSSLGVASGVILVAASALLGGALVVSRRATAADRDRRLDSVPQKAT